MFDGFLVKPAKETNDNEQFTNLCGGIRSTSNVKHRLEAEQSNEHRLRRVLVNN